MARRGTTAGRPHAELPFVPPSRRSTGHVRTQPPTSRFLNTHRDGRTVRLVHPLRYHTDAPVGGSADQLLADIYNFDRRPGRVYLAA